MVADKDIRNGKLKNDQLMRSLTLIQTLEMYDVPQIIVATDAMGTHYLCTLFSQTEKGYQYIGVQISEPRLMAFIGGQLDLRDAYLHPEADEAIWLVTMQHEQLVALRILSQEELTEEKLPEAGYYYDDSDLSEEPETSVDTYQLIVPTNDRITFSTIISRMGWNASTLRKKIGKIAIL